MSAPIGYYFEPRHIYAAECLACSYEGVMSGKVCLQSVTENDGHCSPLGKMLKCDVSLLKECVSCSCC